MGANLAVWLGIGEGRLYTPERTAGLPEIAPLSPLGPGYRIFYRCRPWAATLVEVDTDDG
jgi:hypothetical protein